jgi:putative oxidoreductase
MSTKIKSILAIAARVVLGLIYFVFGLNFFLQFLPQQPQPEGVVAAFTGGLFQSGYFFPLLKGIEVITGALLLIGFFVPLSLVVLAPISINIFLFHTILAPEAAPMGILILFLNLYLAWVYRDHYKPLFERKATLSV